MQNQRTDVGELLQDLGMPRLVITPEGLWAGRRTAVPHEVRYHTLTPNSNVSLTPPPHVDISRRRHKTTCSASPRFICPFRSQPTFRNDCGTPFVDVVYRSALAELSTSAAAAALKAAKDVASNAP